MKHYLQNLLIPILLALGSLGITGYNAYMHNDKELTSRVTAVEVQQKNDGGRLERMEDKLDRVVEAVTGRKP